MRTEGDGKVEGASTLVLGLYNGIEFTEAADPLKAAVVAAIATVYALGRLIIRGRTRSV